MKKFLLCMLVFLGQFFLKPNDSSAFFQDKSKSIDVKAYFGFGLSLGGEKSSATKGDTTPPGRRNIVDPFDVSSAFNYGGTIRLGAEMNYKILYSALEFNTNLYQQRMFQRKVTGVSIDDDNRRQQELSGVIKNFMYDVGMSLKIGVGRKTKFYGILDLRGKFTDDAHATHSNIANTYFEPIHSHIRV